MHCLPKCNSLKIYYYCILSFHKSIHFCKSNFPRSFTHIRFMRIWTYILNIPLFHFLFRLEKFLYNLRHINQNGISLEYKLVCICVRMKKNVIYEKQISLLNRHFVFKRRCLKFAAKIVILYFNTDNLGHKYLKMN